MSVYFVKGKGWRYDFIQAGRRLTEAWFKTRREAAQAESKRREATAEKRSPETPTDMGFLELVNRRLDHVKAYGSEKHYSDYRYLARRWIELWGELSCAEIGQEAVEKFVLDRSRVSSYTANQEIRYLRATFNFGKKKRWVSNNPTDGLEFLPVEKRVKYVPPQEDIDKVIAFADEDTQDYLWVICDTVARVSEINRLSWDDLDLQNRHVVLYTRKKKGGHLTPRAVPMTDRLFAIFSRRFAGRDQDKPWDFWHRYWSRKGRKWCEGPYRDRKRFMRTLCENAGVRYFRFHALRHAGASVMDNNRVPLGAIQRILGHENRETTEIYLHSIGQTERDAIAVLERARQTSRTESHTESHTAAENRKDDGCKLLAGLVELAGIEPATS